VAGIPHLVMAMAHDQPDNANRLRRLGVGMGITPRQFKGSRVAECLKHLLESSEVAQHCADCARRMQDDPQTESLLDWIEEH